MTCDASTTRNDRAAKLAGDAAVTVDRELVGASRWHRADLELGHRLAACRMPVVRGSGVGATTAHTASRAPSGPACRPLPDVSRPARIARALPSALWFPSAPTSQP